MKLLTDFLKPFAIAMVILIAISAGWYLVLYRPDASRSEVLKGETEQLMIQLQSFRVTDMQISTLQTQIEKLNVELAKTNARVCPKDDLPKLIDDIKAKGIANGLKFITIIPEYGDLVSKPNEESTAIIKLTVHFQIQGFYKNFGNFVESLATLPFFVSMGNCTMTYEESVFPQILITMDVVLYLSQSPTQTDAGKTWQS
jgi:Tfp pilus assembly protein PilO